MARVPQLDPDDPDTEPDAVRALQDMQKRYGAIANVQRALANHPALLTTVFDMADVAYFDNGLDPVTRELAYYTSAVANECHF